MRKTIMLGSLIALFGIGALAQAKDVTATNQESAAEVIQSDRPVVRGEHMPDRRSASPEYRREAREGDREHDDKAGERHGDSR